MNYLDRTLDAMQNFHGKWDAAEQSSRAMALLWNFDRSDAVCPLWPPNVEERPTLLTN